MLLNTWDKLNSWKDAIFGPGGFWGINTGWANGCGKELFSLGWVQCDQEGISGIPTSGRINRRVNFSRIVTFLKRPRFKC